MIRKTPDNTPNDVAPSKGTRLRSTEGKLRIGDEWNAIRIIAHSQTHPLKALCELIENAIDAGSDHIEITRRRSGGEIYLEIADNGNGVRLNKDGMPDFEYLATHICDSLKRHLTASGRKGVHGEFGIGLFSFWSLGDTLKMASLDKSGDAHELRLTRGEPKYEIQRLSSARQERGTRVTVGPLIESTHRILTGDKMKKFLGAELRDRIRERGVVIEIADRIARRQLIVKPVDFSGEPLTDFRELKTRFGAARLQMYLLDRSSQSRNGDTGTVALAKDGTRVLADIASLHPFKTAPWNGGRLEGLIDFPAINLAPGTRQGVIPDEVFDALIESLRAIEDEVCEAIRRRDKAATARANKAVLLQVKRAFADALKGLEDQYLYFDVPNPKPRSNGIWKKQRKAKRRKVVDPESHIAPTTAPGQLDHVVITPRNARRTPGSKCVLMAQASDASEPLSDRVKYTWRIIEGDGKITEVEGPRCELSSRKIGRVAIEVTASKGIREATDQVSVKYLSESDSDVGSLKGLPNYRLQGATGEPWRSRFDVKRNQIVINSAHRDCISSQTSQAKYRRYVGKLYAKEVVLLNFPHETSGQAMERLIEVIVRTEDAL